MTGHVRMLADLNRSQAPEVGGKAANLGELGRIAGVRVPDGFCVTTAAFRQAMATAARSTHGLLDGLAEAGPDDTDAIRRLSANLRRAIEDAAMPDDVAAAITDELVRLGPDAAYAVRSSATAEDLPTASFAGQHDTHLNVIGPAAVLDHVRRCWASLFTERAVAYRLRNDMDLRQAQMAVVIQPMIDADIAGVAFTADPTTGNRRTAAIEAVHGLGEALVAGLVAPDTWLVHDGTIVSRTVAAKPIAVHLSPAGGTEQVPVRPQRRSQPTLTDTQVKRLVDVARQIEAHFAVPQDVEWCLTGDDVWIVQSRPITTLFPPPRVDDDRNHVFVSVGHGQMMTDAMTPLGLAFWRLTSPAPMREAGGRLFVDVTDRLASPTGRADLLQVMGRGDPLIGDALHTIVDRGDFLPSALEDVPGNALPGTEAVPLDLDPAIVPELMSQVDESIARLEADILGVTGTELIDLVHDDFQELRRLLFAPDSSHAVMAGMQATWWLNERLREWLGDKDAADTLAQSVPHNVTAQMGLALMDVADRIRPHGNVVAFLEQPPLDWLDRLAGLPGGDDAREAIVAFLARYGARCVAEIDVTRPRWAERPEALLPMILNNVRNFDPGAGRERFERGREQAAAKRTEVLARLRTLPDGNRKAVETDEMIDRLRAFTGYREFPKFGMVRRYLVHKRALLDEARRLVHANVIDDPEDIFWLTLDELRRVIDCQEADHEQISVRKEAFASHQRLTPPRVITSDGEVITGSYRRDDIRDGALIGLGVSTGTVEGRARVVTRTDDASFEPGDILVTTFTDPSWTPAFVAVSGLVTEAGGLMTHGAVIAREYGLPAVVGVDRATRLIRDGQRIRVDGTDGHVVILAE